VGRRRSAQREAGKADGASDTVRRADLPGAEQLDIAVRAYAERKGQKFGSAPHRRPQIPSTWTLVFDTETTVDASQRLRFGTYETRDGASLDERGIFYADDDPDALTRADVEVIRRYAKRHKLTLRTVSDFIDNVLYEYGFHFRAAIVGFNLPFDISRLAIRHDGARAVTITPQDDPEARVTNRNMVGGFTFKLSRHSRANIRIKHRSSRDAFYQFVKLKRGGYERRGFFVDVNTIAAAMLGHPFSLETLCQELNVQHKKLADAEHGRAITDRYLDYAVRDTFATWECFVQLRDRYKSYGLTKTPLHTLHSEASVGKAHLKEMGIRPLLEVQPDVPRDLLGAAMNSYFGGRSEVHIRRTVTRVLYCDFLSMYPTVSVLMGLWSWVRANGISHVDATDEIRAALDAVTLDDLQKPSTWPTLTALVQVRPSADVFPVRAKYAVGDEQYRLALNHLSSDGPLWFTLADCIASKLLTGKAPEVVKAYRIKPGPTQAGLKPIDIVGNPRYPVDPRHDDFYRRLIDLRQEVKRKAKGASGSQATALDHEQLAIKTIANATTYGIFIELNVQDERTPGSGTCYGPSDGALPVESSKFEQPGAFFHPFVAVFTTGAARLMLAIAERLIRDKGLDWAFCDTDSMAIAKPDRMTDKSFLALGTEVRDWFTPLNPYADRGPVFKIEDENFSLARGKAGKTIAPLYCYAISPKRYALFNVDGDGRPIIRKVSAHGLGHLLSPTATETFPLSVAKPAVKLEALEVRAWQYCFWYRIIEAALAGHHRPKIDDLPGFTDPAATQYSASTPSILDWCKGLNESLPYSSQVKPFGFMLRFYAGQIPTEPVSVEHGSRRHAKAPESPRPIAPYDKDTNKAAYNCFDRKTRRPIARELLSSYRDELRQYHMHPDSKFMRTEYNDQGATFRRHIQVRDVSYIGKEADRLEEQLELGADPDAVIEYDTASDTLIMRLRSELSNANLSRLRSASGVSRQSLSAVRDGHSPTKRIAGKIYRGLRKIAAADQHRDRETARLLALVRSIHQRIGLRSLAAWLRIDHSTLSQVLNGKRTLPKRLRRLLDTKAK